MKIASKVKNKHKQYPVVLNNRTVTTVWYIDDLAQKHISTPSHFWHKLSKIINYLYTYRPNTQDSLISYKHYSSPILFINSFSLAPKRGFVSSSATCSSVETLFTPISPSVTFSLTKKCLMRICIVRLWYSGFWDNLIAASLSIWITGMPSYSTISFNNRFNHTTSELLHWLQ